MTFARLLCAGVLLAAAPAIQACAAEPAPAAKAAPAATTRLIARDGVRIAFHVIPGSRGVIVLDAGAGEDSAHWSKLAPELAKRTGFTVISYDRAGYGKSDERKGPLDLPAAVADLEHGLKTLGATRNVILVSHSFAGEIATYLTGQHPDWFAGAVLEDASIPDYFTDETIAYSTKFYDATLAEMRSAPSTRETRGFLALAASWEPTTKAFHKIEWPAAVPVVVIVSEKTPVGPGAPAQWWRDAQAQFAKRAPNRTLVTATGSSHDVAKDRPELILQAVDSMAANIR
jgi:pimeloyl-ACP methyl ester carboxylesterase